MIISCQKAAELSSRQLDEPLPFRGRLALRLHVMMCALCRTFGAQLEMLRRFSRAAGDSGPDSAVARGRVMRDTLSPTARARMKEALSGRD